MKESCDIDNGKDDLGFRLDRVLVGVGEPPSVSSNGRRGGTDWFLDSSSLLGLAAASRNVLPSSSSKCLVFSSKSANLLRIETEKY